MSSFFKRLFEPKAEQAAAPGRPERAYQYDEKRAAQERADAAVILRTAETLSKQIGKHIREIKADFQRRPAAPGTGAGATPEDRYGGAAQLVALLTGGHTSAAKRRGSARLSGLSFSQSQQQAESLIDEMLDSALEDEQEGDLIGTLLRYRDSPALARKCTEAANLPSNLLTCLRLMRIIEMEKASDAAAAARRHEGAAGAAKDAPGAEKDAPGTAKDADGATEGAGEEEAAGPPTDGACARLTELLRVLFRDACTGDQVRQQLKSLAALACERYPAGAVHVQRAACDILCAVAEGNTLTSTTVWFAHDNKIVKEMLKSVRPLVAFGGAEGGAPASPVDDLVLQGPAAERSGAWVLAARAIVALVESSCRHSGALLDDLRLARAYEVLLHAARHSTGPRLAEMLRLFVRLCCCSEPAMGRQGAASGPDSAADVARNADAARVLSRLVLDALPLVPAGALDAAEGEGAVRAAVAAAARRAARIAVGEEAMPAAAAFPAAATAEHGWEGYLRQVLDALFEVYSKHPSNHGLLEADFAFLRLYLAGLPLFRHRELRIMTLKALEMVCTTITEAAPALSLQGACAALEACCAQAHACAASNAEGAARLLDTLHLLLETLEKLLQFDGAYREVLAADCGILADVLKPLLERLAADAAPPPPAASLCALLCQLLMRLLVGSPRNARLLRSAKVPAVLFRIAASDALAAGGWRCASSALGVLEVAATCGANGLAQDLRRINGMLRRAAAPPDAAPSAAERARGRQRMLLQSLQAILVAHPAAPGLWRRQGGFEAVVHLVLLPLDGAFAAEPPKAPALLDAAADLLDAAVDALVVAIVADPTLVAPGAAAEAPAAAPPCTLDTANRRYLRSAIGYDLLFRCLANSGVLSHEAYAPRAAEALLRLVALETAASSSVSLRAEAPKISATRAPHRTAAAAADAHASGELEPPALGASGLALANPEAALALLDCLPQLPPGAALGALDALMARVASGGAAARRAAVASGLVRHAFRRLWQPVVAARGAGHALSAALLRALGALCAAGLPAQDWAALLQCAGAELAAYLPRGALVLTIEGTPRGRHRALHRRVVAPEGGPAHWLRLDDAAAPHRSPRAAPSADKWALFEAPLLALRAAADAGVPFTRVGGVELAAVAAAGAGGDRDDYLGALHAAGGRLVVVPRVGRAVEPARPGGGGGACCAPQGPGVDHEAAAVDSEGAQRKMRPMASVVSRRNSVTRAAGVYEDAARWRAEGDDAEATGERRKETRRRRRRRRRRGGAGGGGPGGSGAAAAAAERARRGRRRGGGRRRELPERGRVQHRAVAAVRRGGGAAAAGEHAPLLRAGARGARAAAQRPRDGRAGGGSRRGKRGTARRSRRGGARRSGGWRRAGSGRRPRRRARRGRWTARRGRWSGCCGSAAW